jgi:hypothetical protein
MLAFPHPGATPKACDHVRRGFFQVPIRDGRLQACERCLDCGRNPRRQMWVSRAELPCPVSELPLLAPPPSPQLLLFPGL